MTASQQPIGTGSHRAEDKSRKRAGCEHDNAPSARTSFPTASKRGRHVADSVRAKYRREKWQVDHKERNKGEKR